MTGLPPGQKYIPNFIIYRILGQPEIDLSSWTLSVEGEVRKPVKLNYKEILGLPRKKITRDFHCVTGWSVKSVIWEGVLLKVFYQLTQPMENVSWVFFESYDGYTSTVAIEDFLRDDAMLVLKKNGKPLEPEEGGPARIFIPHLYGWKGAKWVKRIVFLKEYKDGYWEALGYHERGRAEFEERFKE